MEATFINRKALPIYPRLEGTCRNSWRNKTKKRRKKKAEKEDYIKKSSGCSSSMEINLGSNLFKIYNCKVKKYLYN